MAFDQKKFDRGRRKAFKRLAAYRGLKQGDNPHLHMALNALFDRIEEEGRQINRGEAPVADKEKVHTAIRALKNEHAYSVNAQWWLDNQEKYLESRLWGEARIEAAKEHVQHIGAWSKTTGLPAELRSYLTLEKVPGAAFMDNVDWGFDYDTPSPTLNYMWGESSLTFMGGARGIVDADVYRGIDESSVLNKIEMPELLIKIEAGEVAGVTFHVRRRNQQTSVLDETATYTVRSQLSWDQIPMLDRTESYRVEQGREYQTQQVSRSILRNRQGLQGSLDDFTEIINRAYSDPDTAVFMTGENAAFPYPEMKVTPEQMTGWERPAERSLNDKLAVHSAAQGSMSSASTGSGPHVPGDHARRDSHQTTASGYSSESGNFLAPVNTLASDEWGMFMSPDSLQQLPTDGRTIYSYEGATNPVTTGQLPNPEHGFESEYGFGDELLSPMSQLSMFPPGELDPTPGNGQDYFGAYYQHNVSNPPVTQNQYEEDGASGLYASHNPTSGYEHPVQGGYDTQGSTSSSEGFGEPLARVPARRRRR
ncbi:hypothetical protein ABZT03_41420 [Streptomyces sp. NPDC005574]|uniref:hypothetical protein n=1 Tax=Streptomyces sp. NPDC005574 TaxID=3156891 RepID=UPI0033A6552C